MQPRPLLPVETALAPGEQAPLDQSIAPREARHRGQSAFRLVSEGTEAFAILARSARLARRSLDVQTFIWPQSSGASLHTKAIVINHKTVFVGSYNLDPRSAWLNCEQGVLVESEALAREMAELSARQITGQRAWHVTLVRGDLRRSDGTENFSSDPNSSFAQRLQAWVVRVLRLDAQL